MTLNPKDTQNSGFTLVELLVVLAIVGTLIALLLPAVAAAREAARRATCTSNLKELALASLQHHDAIGSMPYGGWGHAWTGLGTQGQGRRQPGGWAFAILPHIEQQTLFGMDEGKSPVDAEVARSLRLEVSLPVFTCPTRRPSIAWPTSDVFLAAPTIPQPHLRTPRMCGTVERVARGDYAINSGTLHITSLPGPISLEEGLSPEFDWPSTKTYDGISHIRAGIQGRKIADGLSHTYLIGEKYLDADHYFDGLAAGDNETLYSGYCSDLHRFGRVDLIPERDSPAGLVPLGDWRFGSAHANALNIAMCDGAVRVLSYDVDPIIHSQAATRVDMPKPQPPRF
jgi:prepilin-type N-terminal cleavage/methylation domain-containing protein/prepilin-type processing-associated H-X9-DG protein